MEMGAPMKSGGMCPCPHHKVVPAVMTACVILFGVAFLFANLGWITARTAGILWPLAIVLFGLAKLAKYACSCCKTDMMSCCKPEMPK
jgi:hypothetical protein